MGSPMVKNGGGTIMKINLNIEFESVEEFEEYMQKEHITLSNGMTEQVEDIKRTKKQIRNSFFREYGATDKLPSFVDVTPNGTLKLKHGYAKNYDIHTLIALKKLIPLVDEYPKWEDLRNAVHTPVNILTVKRICYAIEQGNADEVIRKWENMSPKYDKFGQVIGVEYLK